VSRRNTFVGGTCAPPSALLDYKTIDKSCLVRVLKPAPFYTQ